MLIVCRLILGMLAATPLLVLASEPPPQLAALRTEHESIVTQDGSPVVLRGVNLGGWLVEELWMLPFESKPAEGTNFETITSHTTLWRTIEDRYGSADMLRIRKAWRENWITKADFVRIKAAGLNSVRLPFLYDSLDDPDGLFPWIDQALSWAREVGIYVILDLHGAPGRQSAEHHTGEAKVDRLFKDPAMVDDTIAVWRQVAERYKDHPEVAGFDLLNEPTGAENDATLYLVYDRLYKAVRAVAPDKIVFIEDAYKGIQGMPYPQIVGWKNVVFSPHLYKFDAKSADDHLQNLAQTVDKIEQVRRERDVPIYIGEFNIEPFGSGDVMKKFVETFDKSKISWSVWTYKTALREGGGGMWGWFRAPRSPEVINPFTDTVEQMLGKITSVRTENLEQSAVKDAFQTTAIPKIVIKN